MLPVVFTVGPDVNSRGANTKSAGQRLLDLPGDHDNLSATHHPGLNEETNPHAREDRGDALMKFAMLLADSTANSKSTNSQQFVENIVKGVIEGETRVLVSSMTMEEIFTEREVFKKRIYRNIQIELDQFGLKIYNANVKELKDAPNSGYFEALSRKAHEGATNQARIDVADAQLRGNVGEAQRKGEQDREIAKINAETAVQKTERDSERAQAEAQLATRKTVLERDVSIAGIEAKRATEAKDQELKREVELKRAAAEVERLRASDVVKATIARESKQQAADAKAYETKRDADAKAYEVEAQAKADFIRKKQVVEAEAYKIKQEADAEAYKTTQDADARNYAVIKEAEAGLQAELNHAKGLEAMANAYIKLGQAFGGPEGLLQWIKIKEGTYIDLAKAQAAGLQGLNPKISWWGGANQGGSSSGEGGSGGNVSQVDAVRNLYTMLPPLMTTIHEQTGITMPEWQYGRLQNADGDGKKVNGTK